MFNVNHSKFGIGSACSNGNYVKITFSDCEKSFDPVFLMNNFDKMFKDTTDEFKNYLTEFANSIIQKKEIEKQQAEQKRLEQELAIRKQMLEQIAEKNQDAAQRVNKDVDPEFCKLFYAGATDVNVANDNDLFYILGFIAGHASKVIAQMTWDRVEDFLSIFPDAEYHEVHRTSEGRDTDCCFRIIFPKNITVPTIMENALVENTSGYQLAKSAFVFRLAHDYGLLFGENVADVHYMKTLAETKGCLDDFVNGYYA